MMNRPLNHNPDQHASANGRPVKWEELEWIDTHKMGTHAVRFVHHPYKMLVAYVQDGGWRPVIIPSKIADEVKVRFLDRLPHGLMHLFVAYALDRNDGRLKLMEGPQSLFKPVGEWAELTGNDAGAVSAPDFSVDFSAPKVYLTMREANAKIAKLNRASPDYEDVVESIMDRVERYPHEIFPVDFFASPYSTMNTFTDAEKSLIRESFVRLDELFNPDPAVDVIQLLERTAQRGSLVCPDCKGNKEIQLFVRKVPCTRCNSTGIV